MSEITIKEKGTDENWSGQNIVKVTDVDEVAIRISQYTSHYGEANCSIPHVTSIRLPKSMIDEVIRALEISGEVK